MTSRSQAASGSRISRAFSSAAILAGGTVAALLIAEVLVRLVRPQSTVRYEYHEDVGALLVPGQHSRHRGTDFDVEVSTNSAGFRDVEHAVRKPADTYRILLLGDSYVEALQVPFPSSITADLAREIPTLEGRATEIVNFGISGNGPAQYLALLKARGLAYSPDLVVVFVTLDNDVRDTLPELSDASYKPYFSLRPDDTLAFVAPALDPRAAGAKAAARSSAVLQLVRSATRGSALERLAGHLGLAAPANPPGPGDAGDLSVYLKSPPPPWPLALRTSARILREIADISHAGGARVLLVTIPSVATVEDRWNERITACGAACAGLEWDFEAPERLVRSAAADAGLPLVSLAAPFAKDYAEHRSSASFAHDGHWNERGHSLAAETLASALENLPTMDHQ